MNEIWIILDCRGVFRAKDVFQHFYVNCINKGGSENLSIFSTETWYYDIIWYIIILPEYNPYCIGKRKVQYEWLSRLQPGTTETMCPRILDPFCHFFLLAYTVHNFCKVVTPSKIPLKLNLSFSIQWEEGGRAKNIIMIFFIFT